VEIFSTRDAAQHALAALIAERSAELAITHKPPN
jgi:hypothetical protein